MKTRLLLTAVLFAVASTMSLHAQYFTVGPEVGYERANLHAASDEASGRMSAKSGNGFRIGAVASYHFKSGLFLHAGLSYSHRESAAVYGTDGVGSLPFVKDVKIRNMEFLTLPVTVGYEIGLAHGWAVGVEAGAYVGAGLGNGSVMFTNSDGEGNAGSLFGKSEFTHYDTSTGRREPVTIDGSDRIDAGFAFGGNVRFRSVRLRALYQLGLNKTIYDIAVPRTFVLSLCYDFRL